MKVERIAKTYLSPGKEISNPSHCWDHRRKKQNRNCYESIDYKSFPVIGDMVGVIAVIVRTVIIVFLMLLMFRRI